MYNNNFKHYFSPYSKGFVKNIVSAWEYYPVREVKEAIIDDKHLVIMVHDAIPLFWYSKDSKNGLI